MGTIFKFKNEIKIDSGANTVSRPTSILSDALSLFYYASAFCLCLEIDKTNTAWRVSCNVAGRQTCISIVNICHLYIVFPYTVYLLLYILDMGTKV